MKNTLSFTGPEPLNAAMEHPVGAAVGGALTGMLCGAIGAMASGVWVGLLMGALGLVIGAAGGAHLAETTERNRTV